MSGWPPERSPTPLPAAGHPRAWFTSKMPGRGDVALLFLALCLPLPVLFKGRIFGSAWQLTSQDYLRLATGDAQTQHLVDGGGVVSLPLIYLTKNSGGARRRYFFRFRNVHLTNDTMTVYYPRGFSPPQEEHWVDPMIGNTTATRAELPTMFMTSANGGKVYLRVQYLPSWEYQPTCTSWVNRTQYILQLTKSSNYFHNMHDGVAAAFQTAREVGLLPLVEVISSNGTMVEYTLGMGHLKGCRWVLDPITQQPRQPAPGECPRRTGVVPVHRCDPGKQAWCKPGAVVVYDRSAAPAIKEFKGAEVHDNMWRHLYDAITDDVRTWEDDMSACFKDVLIGRPNTVNFFTEVKAKEETIAKVFRRQRFDALQAFTQFVLSALCKWEAEQEEVLDKSVPWPGYEDPAMERLRQGIGPEEVELVQALKRRRASMREVGRMEAEEIAELKRLWKESAETVTKLVAANQLRDAALVAAGNWTAVLPPKNLRSWSPHESLRPVVTYMHRDGGSREVLNPQDILTYLLSRYNVTVKVTTFAETLLEAIKLMGSSDVVLGMHGAGWTNALFMKQGGAAMQLAPYGWEINGTGHILRGSDYESMARARGCQYSQWVCERPEHAFMRRRDFEQMQKHAHGPNISYALHPQPDWPEPIDSHPGHHVIYQNTFVDINTFSAKLDELLRQAGIAPMQSG